MTENQDINRIRYKRWKARLVVCGLMLLLALIGLIIMDIHPKTYWLYSRIMAVLYAALSLWLFWYLNRKGHKITGSTIWHHLLHWLALIIATYLVALMVNSGIMGSREAGLVTLILLALTIFLAGIYTDASFMLIGIALAIFAAGAGLVMAYLSIIMIPVILLTALVIFILMHRERRKET